MKVIYIVIGFIVFWSLFISAAVFCINYLWKILWTKIDIGTLWVIITGKNKKWGQLEIDRTKEHLILWEKDKSLIGFWKRFLIRQLLKPHD